MPHPGAASPQRRLPRDPVCKKMERVCNWCVQRSFIVARRLYRGWGGKDAQPVISPDHGDTKMFLGTSADGTANVQKPLPPSHTTWSPCQRKPRLGFTGAQDQSRKSF